MDVYVLLDNQYEVFANEPTSSGLLGVFSSFEKAAQAVIATEGLQNWKTEDDHWRLDLPCDFAVDDYRRWYTLERRVLDSGYEA